MEISQRNILVGACILGIVAVGAYLYLYPAAPAPRAPEGNYSASSSPAMQAYTVTGESQNTLQLGSSAHPSLDRPLSFSVDVSDEAKVALRSQFVRLVAELTKNSKQMDLWLSLGTVRHIAGDYEGAIEDWSFVALNKNSLSSTAFGNLGDVYLNSVKNYPKAEAHYKAAIALEPAYVDYYRALFDLYTTTSYKPSSTAAEDILKKGISANPNAVELHVILARYYKSVGRTTDAKTEYQAAITSAEAQGLTSLAAQIQEEKNSL